MRLLQCVVAPSIHQGTHNKRVLQIQLSIRSDDRVIPWRRAAKLAGNAASTRSPITPSESHRLPRSAALAASAQAPSPASPAGRLDTRLNTAPSRIVPVDRIVAVVNDEVITQNDLNDRVSLVVRQLQRQGGQLPPADALSRQILERMITDLLQVQLAKETGLNVDAPTLDKTIERIAQENSCRWRSFRAALDKDGSDFRVPRGHRSDICRRPA